MPEYNIRLSELFPAWQKEIRKNRQAVMEGISVTAKTAVRILSTASPVDTGLFKESWLVIPVNGGLDVVNEAPYAEWIENGSRPHWPPPGPIKQWLLRKIKIVGRERLSRGMEPALQTKTGRARGVHRRKGAIVAADERVIDELTYMICKKISEEGTPPHHILRNNYPRIVELLKHNTEGFLRTRR